MTDFAHLIAPVVATTSIILSSNEIQNGDILEPANPGPPGKWPLKWREFPALNVLGVNIVWNDSIILSAMWSVEGSEWCGTFITGGEIPAADWLFEEWETWEQWQPSVLATSWSTEQTVGHERLQCYSVQYCSYLQVVSDTQTSCGYIESTTVQVLYLLLVKWVSGDVRKHLKP